MGRPPKKVNSEVGSRIKFIRRRLRDEKGNKITQSMFAEHFNVSEQTVRNWENGTYNVPINVIQELATKLNIDTDFILGKYDTPTLNEKITNWDVKFGSSINQQQKLISYIEDLGYNIASLDEDTWENIYSEIKEFIILKLSKI